MAVDTGRRTGLLQRRHYKKEPALNPTIYIVISDVSLCSSLFRTLFKLGLQILTINSTINR